MRTRSWAAALLALLWCLLLSARVSAAAPVAVTAVDSVGIPVTDLERSVRFYSEVLQFRKVAETEIAGDRWEHLYGVFGLRLRVARMQLGRESIELMQVLAPRGRPLPPDTHSNDRWFQHVAIIVSDMSRAYARLREYRVEHASSGPQRLPDWNPNAGGIEAFYFRDPDGNHLEVLQFPPGKGEPRWQQRDGQLFLGIDHTAIVVADTDASLAFYRDRLGLRVAGSSENYGTEQEHLNNVFGARLRITALRAASGPGVELLEYLAPRTGRPIPVDSDASDRWFWQIRMLDQEPAALEPALRSDRRTIVSGGTIDVEPVLGYSRGLLVRDPDGHASLLTRAREN